SGDAAPLECRGRFVHGLLGEMVGRALLPSHLARWIRCQLVRRRETATEADAQLLLYSRMLSSGFLHFGYFDDPDTAPEEVSFALLERAQLRYAERVAELVGPPPGTLLEAGCGMGGMLGVFRARGHEATGLTPDRFQIGHLRRTLPDVPILHCRFEDLGSDRFSYENVTTDPQELYRSPSKSHCDHECDKYIGYFDTIVHAESLQYMRPDGALRALERALAPDGRWIVADYFRLDESAAGVAGRAASHDGRARSARSGWCLGEYRRLLEERGFEIEAEEDITPHVLPTLGFARLLAERIGLPAFDFGSEKLRVKLPGLHYVVRPALERARRRARREASQLDPEVFSATRRYLLMRIRRSVASRPWGR
ncbi:MAG: methyltransferase domain-containing protein, partial [Gemmatimonadetes bacterium]|nr:methyltransferase domain-containing protein [Gemmatimonadota bacterium]